MIIILLLGFCYAMAIVGYSPRMPICVPVEKTDEWEVIC